jgi:hypothetical protein
VSPVEVDSQTEDRAVEAEVENHPEREGDRKRALSEQDGVDHRVADGALDEDEPGHARNASGQQRERESPSPPLATGDDEPAGQCRQSNGGKDLAREVKWVTVSRRFYNVTAE